MVDSSAGGAALARSLPVKAWSVPCVILPETDVIPAG
jgi:hypothetical protein